MARARNNWGEKIPIEDLQVEPYTIPTDLPESDGTLEWDRTTLVVVRASAGGVQSLGYGYADEATAHLIHQTLRNVVIGMDAMNTSANWWAMVRRIRNLGRPGICSMAISCVDVALWDLKARLLDVPVLTLLGGEVKPSTPVYGSGGFTSYTDEQLRRQFRSWVNEGISMVKMKIGRDARADVHRVQVAREEIGTEVELFVDANGGYSRKQALYQAEKFRDFDVRWFEEPVSSDDLDGLRLIRDRAPAMMDIAAGEYGYDEYYFRRMLNAGAVDVLQADATRCGGFTGFLHAAGLCVSHGMPLSTHTAPTLHASLGCALQQIRHMEYFHDHVRIERQFFDGFREPIGGTLGPDRSRPGLGLELKEADARKFAA